MKRITTLTFVFAATFLTMTSALHAQTDVLRTTVPFTFAVGDRILPPGNYEIESHGSFVRLQNRDGNSGLFAIPTAGDPSSDGRSQLLFDLRDGHYSLKDIVTPSSVTSAVFPKSR